MTEWLLIAKNAIDFIKSAGGLIKPKGEFKEIAKDPEFQQEFLKQKGNNVIINVKGDLYLGDYDAIRNKKELLEGFRTTEKTEKTKDISFFDVGFYPRVEKFSETKKSDKNLDKYLEFTEPGVRNLFEMSFYARVLFEEKNDKEANSVRSDIGNQYGKMGRKFCNLYLKGYVHEFVEHLIAKYDDGKEALERDYNSQIIHFVTHSDTIFFIHSGKEHLKDVTTKVTIAINRDEPYIALHAGGKMHIDNSLKILKKVKTHAIEKGYSIKEIPLKSKSKTPLYDIYIAKEKKFHGINKFIEHRF